jgi:hypothetical protein
MPAKKRSTKKGPARKRSTKKRAPRNPTPRKKTSSRKAQRAPARAAHPEWASPKFAGIIEIEPPAKGKAVSSKSHVVLTLASVGFGKLPDLGRRSEMRLDVAVRTTNDKNKEASVSRSSDIYYYVLDDTRMNIFNMVLYDGPVHQHLTLEVEATEVEMPRMSASDVSAVLSSALGGVGEAAGVSGGAESLLDAVPGVVGGLLKLNGDDQVLKFATSLFTSNVALPPGGHGLKTGTYTFKKVEKAGGEPWATLKLHVAVPATT